MNFITMSSYHQKYYHRKRKRNIKLYLKINANKFRLVL